MSAVKYPETMNSREVQVWDTAAFDNEESESSAAIKFSWSTVNPSSINLSQSLESDSTKENQSPSMAGSPVSMKSMGSINPLQPNTSIINSQLSNPISRVDPLRKKQNLGDEGNLDLEIEEIEKEIHRLSSRLETLRLEKAKRNAKETEKRGRIVAAKFMEVPKQNNIEELMCLSAKMKTPRRGLSLGPEEIMREARRGISLGPAEIYSATKLKQLGKKMSTPVQPSSNRRKSCYWKLQDIDELRVTKERGKSSSLSPKSRSKSKIISKSQVPRQAVTTIGHKKSFKKEDVLVSSIQPKKLFSKDEEKLSAAKKPSKGGRVVPSRYGQISNGGTSATKEVRKTSQEGLPQETARENRVKKRWEIPSEVAIPNIKTLRFASESPRDSGPAKRVVELVGKKSFFNVEEGEESVCQALDFTVESVRKDHLKIKVLRRVDDSPRDSGAAKRVAESVGRKSFFDNDDDHEMPVFSLEESDGEES